MHSTIIILASLLIAYSMVIVLVFLGQRKLIYHPPSEKPMNSYVQTVGLRKWLTQDGTFRGYLSVHPRADSKGTIVLFHGNAGSAADRCYYVQALEPLGFTVVLPEYPGYAGRPGQPGESQFVSDAVVVLQQAHESFGGPLYVWGESLGCGVAAAVVAHTDEPVAGIALLMPWDTLPDLAQTLYWYLPAKWFVRDRFDSIQHLDDFKGPIAVVISENDEVITTKHSLRLYNALTTQKRLWTFSGATHNNWPSNANEPWWTEVIHFLSGEDPKNAGPD